MLRRSFTTKTATIIGSGLMGSGIAQTSAVAGFKVKLVDVEAPLLERALERIKLSLERTAKKKADAAVGAALYVSTALNRIEPVVVAKGESIKPAVDDASIVVEAIVEHLPTKQALFVELEKHAPSSCVFASNTSSLRIDDIAARVQDKSRVGGLHFFNPVPVMKLLEVVRAPSTSDATFATLCEFGKKLGKSVVHCKDTPGFIVNRLLVPYMAEAVRMVQRGDASIVDIDTAMRLGAGYPMGPFTLTDYVGLDTTLFILQGWADSYPSETLFVVPPLLRALVDANFLGAKGNGGFFVQGKPNPAFFDAHGYLKRDAKL